MTERNDLAVFIEENKFVLKITDVFGTENASITILTTSKKKIFYMYFFLKSTPRPVASQQHTQLILVMLVQLSKRIQEYLSAAESAFIKRNQPLAGLSMVLFQGSVGKKAEGSLYLILQYH